jgi:hypothetical protein
MNLFNSLIFFYLSKYVILAIDIDCFFLHTFFCCFHEIFCNICFFSYITKIREIKNFAKTSVIVILLLTIFLSLKVRSIKF